jgi:hypothetical protein
MAMIHKGRYRMWWLWLFPLVGAAMLTGAIIAALNTLDFLRRGQRGVAQVVNYSSHVDEDGDTLHEPTLRLIEPALGHERGTGVSSSERKWKVGTKLRVKVAPDDPRNFQIDSPDDVLTGPLIAGVIGAVFLVMGLAFIFLFNGPRDEVLWEPAQDLQPHELAAPAPESTV